MPNAEMEPAKENPKVIEQQMAQVKDGVHRFKPSRGLPVWINYAEPRDPFELYEEVTYRNGPITVVIPAGFKCDATSTPALVFLTPAFVQLLAALAWWQNFGTTAIVLLWLVGTALSVVLPLVMPAVGQLGLHARATTVHDALYRTQVVSRVVSDAVTLEIMDYDNVRALPKWLIYMMLRAFGGRAWRNNKKRIAAVAKGNPVPDMGVEPISEIAPPTKKN